MVARQVKSTLPTRGTGVPKFNAKKLSGHRIEDLSDEFTEGTMDESDDLSGRSGQSFASLKYPLSGGRRSIIKADSDVAKYISFQRKSWNSLPVPSQATVKSSHSQRIASTTTSTTTRKRSKSVHFGQVQFRTFDQTLGDHPSTSYGPPISLDWHYEDQKSSKVDVYERERQGSRRPMKQLMLNYYQRKNILMWQYGYSETELKKATKEAGRTALQRSVTKYFLPVSKVEEALQSAGRKAKRAVGGNKKENKPDLTAMVEPTKVARQITNPARPVQRSIKKASAPTRPVTNTSRKTTGSIKMTKTESEDELMC